MAKKSTTAKASVKATPSSRKSQVHDLHDKQGAEQAWTLGLKLGLKPSTLRTWFGTWRRDAAKATPKATMKKASAKATDKAAA
jgi:hypothetical protein